MYNILACECAIIFDLPYGILTTFIMFNILACEWIEIIDLLHNMLTARMRATLPQAQWCHTCNPKLQNGIYPRALARHYLALSKNLSACSRAPLSRASPHYPICPRICTPISCAPHRAVKLFGRACSCTPLSWASLYGRYQTIRPCVLSHVIIVSASLCYQIICLRSFVYLSCAPLRANLALTNLMCAPASRSTILRAH